MNDDTKNSHDLYLENVDRLEPSISTIWGAGYAAQSSQATALISIAISVKRIADALQREATQEDTDIASRLISDRMGVGGNGGLYIIDHLARNGFKVVPK